jgi:cytochrome c5
MKKTMIVLLIFGFVLSSMFFAVSCAKKQVKQEAPAIGLESVTTPPAETPAINGATLLDARCSVCHSADRPKKARNTAAQWEKIVTSMIAKGAQLTETEKTVLVDYLAKTYRP